MTSLRVKIITEGKQKRRFDSTVVYNLVGIDDKSRIAFISCDESFLRQMTTGSYLAITNCRLSPRGHNIAISLQESSKVVKLTTTRMMMMSNSSGEPTFSSGQHDRRTAGDQSSVAFCCQQRIQSG